LDISHQIFLLLISIKCDIVPPDEYVYIVGQNLSPLFYAFQSQPRGHLPDLAAMMDRRQE
jgi:hypothetical protein